MKFRRCNNDVIILKTFQKNLKPTPTVSNLIEKHFKKHWQKLSLWSLAGSIINNCAPRLQLVAANKILLRTRVAYVEVSRRNGHCRLMIILSTALHSRKWNSTKHRPSHGSVFQLRSLCYSSTVKRGFTWIRALSVSSGKQQKGLRRPSTQRGQLVSSFFHRHSYFFPRLTLLSVLSC